MTLKDRRILVVLVDEIAHHRAQYFQARLCHVTRVVVFEGTP